MNNKNLLWQSVPLELEPKWREIFTASKEILKLSTPCPVCGQQKLYRYYQGLHNTGRIRSIGALWEWCSACRTYEHSSALVPAWWSQPKLDFDASKLTAEPEIIDQAIRQLNKELE